MESNGWVMWKMGTFKDPVFVGVFVLFLGASRRAMEAWSSIHSFRVLQLGWAADVDDILMVHGESDGSD